MPGCPWCRGAGREALEQMKKLVVSPSLVEIEMVQQCLDAAGIPCMVKNRQGCSLAGEVPFAEVFPELWVKEGDEARAAEILVAESDRLRLDGPTWICVGCGEGHADVFTSCWQCGCARGTTIQPN